MANTEHIKWLRRGVKAWNEHRGREVFEPDLREADIPAELGESGLVESSGAVIRELYLGQGKSRPNLSGIDFSGANLQKAILTNVDLSKANLRGANLRGCELNGATLRDADLDFADLRDCELGCMADLQGASMFGGNCSTEDFNDNSMDGADCSQADLRDAILANRELAETDLRYARLVGANLFRTQPWRALLFAGVSDEKGELGSARSAGPVKSVSCLLQECSNVRGEFPERVLYFRGENRMYPELRPSLMRRESGTFRHLKSEAKMIVDLMSRRPEEFDSLKSALAQWVLAQHHRLPTRLLDITRNPLVALFHACQEAGEGSGEEAGRLHIFAVPEAMVRPFNSDSISVVANFAKLSCEEQKRLLGKREEDTPEDVDPGGAAMGYSYQEAMGRLYHFIRQEKPHFQELIDPRDFFRVFVVEPQGSFERVRAQAGAFLISAFHERFERSEVLRQNEGTPVYDHYTLVVPDGRKHSILSELQLVNVTQEALFPGLDGAASAVRRRHREGQGQDSEGEKEGRSPERTQGISGDSATVL